MISAILIILITILVPPIGVLITAGCGADFLINILLTLLGYFPGHIHAFYIEYVYYKRREDAARGIYDSQPAAGVYSERVQRGGKAFFLKA
ncbi:hypothetical protein GTA08_BOTSDO01418 [Neofusicoccum parvum]|uniref:Putative plasma membrane proteolipid 3 protein n=1 Tax=Botryosphaeria parva (strain UCR-NP2) TaxID=1287680 RepID=R1GM00_BOTPV|nr:putative plasma membrane proteolipid 3 protein [Neofusicoccum parvum UCRNP2]GME65833.1 hypothetical protein GTA08_BOTSDO01418 [Neofusicoccum parvum]